MLRFLLLLLLFVFLFLLRSFLHWLFFNLLFSLGLLVFCLFIALLVIARSLSWCCFLLLSCWVWPFALLDFFVKFGCLLFLLFLGFLLLIKLLLFLFLLRLCSGLFSLNVLSFHGANTVCELAELGHEEAVHVVHVRIDTLGQVAAWVEAQLLVAGQAWLAHFKAGLHKLNVPILESVVDNPFIFLNRNGARRIPKAE